jgi:zinc/manganese transport system substrate-binding protein
VSTFRSSLKLCPLLALAATAAFAAPARAELKIVATVPDLAAVARELGGPAVSVKAMSLPTQDPHFVDAKPSLALDLNHADLLLLVGLDLEVGWLPTLLAGARNPALQSGAPAYLDCSQFVHKLDLPSGTVDRSQGDIHPLGNPHYFTDPRAVAAVARGITERLAELDPGHRATYEANRKAFLERLDAARAGWEKRLAPFRGAPVLGYHKTWSYLCDWLGLDQAGFLEPKPGVPPNPQHVARLLGLARARKVRVVLQEAYYPDATSKLLAEKIPATLLTIPGGTNFPAGQTYVQRMDALVASLAAALEKGR